MRVEWLWNRKIQKDEFFCSAIILYDDELTINDLTMKNAANMYYVKKQIFRQKNSLRKNKIFRSFLIMFTKKYFLIYLLLVS